MGEITELISTISREKRLTEPVPSEARWVSSHFTTLPIAGWPKFVRDFNQKPSSSPNGLGVFQEIMARCIVLPDQTPTNQQPDSIKTIKAFVLKGDLRALTFPQFIFQDDNGHKFSALTLKGTGFTLGQDKRFIPDPDKGFLGAAMSTPMIEDARRQDLLAELGVRTSRTIVVFNIAPKDLDKDTQRQFFNNLGSDSPQQLIPSFGVDVRAFRNPLRLSSLDFDSIDKKKIFDTSIKLLSLTDQLSLTPGEYLTFFASSIANSLGTMAEKGYAHGNLIAHNITLAAEIVDFDTMVDADSITASGEKLSPEDILNLQIIDVINAITRYVNLANTVIQIYPNQVSISSNMALDFIKTYCSKLNKGQANKFKNRYMELMDNEPLFVRLCQKYMLINQDKVQKHFSKFIEGSLCPHLNDFHSSNFCQHCGNRLVEQVVKAGETL